MGSPSRPSSERALRVDEKECFERLTYLEQQLVSDNCRLIDENKKLWVFVGLLIISNVISLLKGYL